MSSFTESAILADSVDVPAILLLLIGLLAPLFHGVGALCAAHALMRNRTSQGAIAWTIALVTFPYLTVPLYALIGRNRFSGYIAARRAGDSDLQHAVTEAKSALQQSLADPKSMSRWRFFERIGQLPCTRGNQVELLIDGPETFASMLEAIAAAKHYVLVEFFVVRSDRLGDAFRDALIAKAQEGIAVYFLYDEVGSNQLPRAYIKELAASGAQIFPFRSSRGWSSRFQLNFRDHRKITVVDGEIGFVGGLNIGDEYMGRDARIGRWRDTHLKLTGPSVLEVQLVFLENWFWCRQEVPALRWEVPPGIESDASVLVLPSGPADELETCEMLILEMIRTADTRIWIASPYFVPDLPVVRALQMAALRGVDVRIMLPDKPDHYSVYLAAFAYIPPMLDTGVRLLRYTDGFLHQKVLLVDDVAAVGTANLDNRSFRFNFEITALLFDDALMYEVDRMLSADFANCREVTTTDYNARPWYFHLAVRIAHLFAPLL
jgi:cardiolipin synthase A/B